MPSTIVTVPDFNFAAFYYPQLLEALVQYKRLNVPELTDESEFEPFQQLLRAFALVGHLNNTLIDLVANESTLPTAQLVETVRNMLRLIDYRMSPATPSTVELVYELARVFNASFALIPAGAQAATQRQGAEPAITFETNEALTIERTDQFGRVVVDESGTFTDRTAAANSANPVDDFDIWTTPDVGDAIYFGHANVMWAKLALTLATPGSGIVGVWEFYDGDFLKTQPDTVIDLGATLRFNINGLLGTSPRPGTTVRVTLNSDGASEDATSVWDGANNYVVVGLLGQSSPSTTASDYTVGSDWSELTEATDNTANLTASDSVEYPVPQSDTRNWARTVIEGFNGFWLRYRIVSVAAPTTPSLRLARMDTGKQYAIRDATQGMVGADDPLGSSTGLPDQRFTTSRDFYIDGTAVVTVDGETWTEVDDFLGSQSNDKHYVVELGNNDRATIVFGSGVNGKVPPIGVNNISVEYRHGANTDGNVGPNTVVVDKTGLTFINGIYNPRQASGWEEAEGASEESLARAKIAGPASLRVRDVALSPSDVEVLATRFTTSLGARPFSRALAIEEGLGPKTIELVVVKKGGGLATSDELDELDLYFNGDKYANPPVPKKVVANQEVTSFNYTQRVIDVDAVVTVRGALTSVEIANALLQIIQPEARREDGVTFEWDFGGTVPRSRISHEIWDTDETKISNVVLNAPAADVVLGSRELPVAGTITITIVEA
ncbi:MAG: hypothetical protein AB7W59_00095 [Acidimicrobiia bacterium]